MNIFETIKNAIFTHASDHATATTPPKTATPPTPGAPATAQSEPKIPALDGKTGMIASPPSNTSAPVLPQPVDIEAVLNGLAQKSGQKLNWRTSIVDLMKAVGLDASLQNRKQLAQELGYKADTGDSAAMNIWLHHQVMVKLEENGGKLPAELRT
jgi:hypothetical protein